MKPDAVVLAHTAVSYLSLFAGEAALHTASRDLTGARAFTAAGAIHAALRHLGAHRLALATPYPESISAAGRTYWEAAGFEIVAHRRLDTPNIYDESEDRAHALGRSADTPTADVVLISGTGLPTAGIIERLEKDLEQARRDQPGRHPLARPDAAADPRPHDGLRPPVIRSQNPTAVAQPRRGGGGQLPGSVLGSGGPVPATYDRARPSRMEPSHPRIEAAPIRVVAQTPGPTRKLSAPAASE